MRPRPQSIGRTSRGATADGDHSPASRRRPGGIREDQFTTFRVATPAGHSSPAARLLNLFVRSGWQFRKIWPPAPWSAPGDHTSLARKTRVPGDGSSPVVQVVGGFADLDGDGRAELICLRDRYQLRPEQALAIYRLSEGAFHLLASAPLRGDHLAYMLSGVDKSSRELEITVFQTTRDRCEVDGWQPEKGGQWQTRYVYRRGELKLLQR